MSLTSTVVSAPHYCTAIRMKGRGPKMAPVHLIVDVFQGFARRCNENSITILKLFSKSKYINRSPNSSHFTERQQYSR